MSRRMKSFTFLHKQIKDLVLRTLDATIFVPTQHQVSQPEYWSADLPASILDLLRAEFEIDGFSFSANLESVDLSRIGPALIFTGVIEGCLESNALSIETKIRPVAAQGFERELPDHSKLAGKLDTVTGLDQTHIEAACVLDLLNRFPGSLIKLIVYGESLYLCPVPTT